MPDKRLELSETRKESLGFESHVSLEALLRTCAAVADALDNGHLTIFKFTTGWKVVLGTPLMEHEERMVLWYEPGRMTLDQALTAFLRKPVDLADRETQAVADKAFRQNKLFISMKNRLLSVPCRTQ